MTETGGRRGESPKLTRTDANSSGKQERLELEVKMKANRRQAKHGY